MSPVITAITGASPIQTWELQGRYPEILADQDRGEAARNLFADAQNMLQQIVAGRWLQARATVGIFPAAAEVDDVVIYTDADRHTELCRLNFLRQQKPKAQGRHNRCLADYIAPATTGLRDHIGLFAVTAGLGIETKLAEYEKAHDDYAAIMLKALADRLAEAFAERLHQRVRTELWAYAADEQLSNEELIAEKYRGIRPAPGYPACPDHSVKRDMFRVLQASAIGMGLTESLAMTPAASVSGFYLAHPDAAYFNVGRIGQDQADDWAARQAMDAATAQRHLAPTL